ncbi:sensor histidine kinase [Nonomuraea sp. NN258]|nr:sensor histidine kinase [Nonomuraea antri]
MTAPAGAAPAWPALVQAGVAPAWPVLVPVAALWLAPIPWLYRRRETRRALVVGHYLGLIVLAWALTSAAEAFVLFAAIGYPLAFALLPVRLVLAGAAATAAVTVLAQVGPGDRAGLLTAIGGIAVPLAFAGWYVSAESDKRRRLIERLRAALAENAGLHARLLDHARHAGVLDERHRMAGEIHDTIAQDLVAMIGQLEALPEPAEPDARRRRAQALRLARQCLAEARRSVRALRPEPLEDSGLPEAIGRMARAWAGTAGVDLALEVTGTPVPLAADVESTLFRVAQEALANVAKHAGATRTGLTLSYTGELVLLDIRDDGAGFAPQAANGGFGLDNMRQRVRAAGGTLEIESGPGQGTAVAVSVPALPVGRVIREGDV